MGWLKFDTIMCTAHRFFSSYAANPENRQFSFCSSKSAILASMISNLDDPLLIRSLDWHRVLFFCWSVLEKKRLNFMLSDLYLTSLLFVGDIVYCFGEL